ncbi:MAG TPA: glycosyltransferase family A protein [Cyclobacteriaceae bacterium]|nr:glycosyltransferase family A protein [Cyclobacteriaceae bacterium]
MTAVAPLVSVLMPSYNCESFVRDSIQGILNQKFTDFEFIIINDGSTDDTGKEIQAFNDSRIRYYENETNLGLIKSLNHGLLLTRGKYILRTDADDIALENMMENLVFFMENNPDYIICGANMKLLDGEKIFRYPNEDDELKVFTLGACPFSHSTVMFRREVVIKYGLRYNEAIKDGEDHGLWSEMLPYGKFKNLDEVTLLYRESPTQVTSSVNYKVNYVLARKYIFEKQARQYFDLGPSDCERYSRFITGDYPVIRDELVLTGRLLLSILKVNSNRRLFNQKRLNRFFFIKWHSTCARAICQPLLLFLIYARFALLSSNIPRPQILLNAIMAKAK